MTNDDPDQIRDADEVRNADQVHETVYNELDIGQEQVSSNECWDADDEASPDAIDYSEPESLIHANLDLGEEQVTSNECFDVEDE
ncbi:MAG: hypothetical protein LC794_05365 [Acidobacteria bacterium]|nr:hypothetical protein [Acidobacteriota bacterium]